MNEKLTVWNGHGPERLTREEFTERALNTPYYSPTYLDYDYFDLTGHILLWEYVRTHLQSVDDIYEFILLKAKGACFINDKEYRERVKDNANCFACVHVRLSATDESRCKECPLEWGCSRCITSSSVYEKFKTAETVEEAREYALQIRDLPVKQGVIVR